MLNYYEQGDRLGDDTTMATLVELRLRLVALRQQSASPRRSFLPFHIRSARFLHYVSDVRLVNGIEHQEQVWCGGLLECPDQRHREQRGRSRTFCRSTCRSCFAGWGEARPAERRTCLRRFGRRGQQRFFVLNGTEREHPGPTVGDTYGGQRHGPQLAEMVWSTGLI